MTISFDKIMVQWWIELVSHSDEVDQCQHFKIKGSSSIIRNSNGINYTGELRTSVIYWCMLLKDALSSTQLNVCFWVPSNFMDDFKWITNGQSRDISICKVLPPAKPHAPFMWTETDQTRRQTTSQIEFKDVSLAICNERSHIKW